jgi:putative membrane protein
LFWQSGFSVAGLLRLSLKESQMNLKNMFLAAALVASSTALGSFARASVPSDAEITNAVISSNDIDINAAKMAKSKSQNKEVLGFADMMINDHTAANKEVNDLNAKLNITPKSNADIMAMGAKAKVSSTKLSAMSGRDFDKAYLDNQIAFHQGVLEDIDKKLAPGAQKQEVKDLLAKVRPTVQMHLDHAKSLLATIH